MLITNAGEIKNSVIFGEVITKYLVNTANIMYVGVSNYGYYFICDNSLKEAIIKAPLWIRMLVGFEDNWKEVFNA
jgi:uncharacterized short protein YbdD (DUF466 family)